MCNTYAKIITSTQVRNLSWPFFFFLDCHPVYLGGFFYFTSLSLLILIPLNPALTVASMTFATKCYLFLPQAAWKTVEYCSIQSTYCGISLSPSLHLIESYLADLKAVVKNLNKSSSFYFLLFSIYNNTSNGLQTTFFSEKAL